MWLRTLFLYYDAASLGIRFPIFRRHYVTSKRRDWFSHDAATCATRISPRDGLCLLSVTDWGFIYNLHEWQTSNAGISPQNHGFDPLSVLVSFVMDKVTSGQVSLRVLYVLHWLSYSTNIPDSSLPECLFLFIRRTNGRSLETSDKAIVFRL